MVWNDIWTGDCLRLLEDVPAGSVDLAFADPPFNIGYEYDQYHDRRSKGDYLAFTDRWLAAVKRTLKPTGSMFVAIGDEYAAEHKVRLDALGLHLRNWIVWHYTFGVSCTRKFNRSHVHIFYYVADPKQYTFNADAVRVKSARQTAYADRRANPLGKLPDDTWYLRPQEADDHFEADSDTWAVSRVCGTFHERTDHPCQMPKRCWSGSSRWRATPATWCSTRSPAAAPRWQSPNGCGGNTWESSCRRRMPTRCGIG